MSDVVREKCRLRVPLKARRASLTVEERARASRRAGAVLMASDLWQQAESTPRRSSFASSASQAHCPASRPMRWIPEYGFGVASEVDRDVAYR
ncbi:MAG: hypothetical protein ACI8PZ_005113 [Myxococcota bacterium]|jgi:hypothetical protein